MDNEFLIFINPFSGKGTGLSIFHKYVSPEFEKAKLHYKLIVTERKNHAYDITRELKLEEWKAVIIISGDGLIYEVINGLMCRADWEQAIKMPIGIIPGGTGNALHTSLCHQFGHLGRQYSEATFVEQSVEMIVRGATTKLDLLKITSLDDGRIYYSILGLSWGFISDVDIESEIFRLIGTFRFLLYGLWRICSLRHYAGELAFVPRGASAPQRVRKVVEKGCGGRLFSAETVKSWIKSPRQQLPSPHLEEAVLPNSPPPPRCTAFSDELGASWNNTELVSLFVSNVSHIAQNVELVPGAKIDDGLAHLCLLKKGVTKFQLLQFLCTTIRASEIDPIHTYFTSLEEIVVNPKDSSSSSGSFVSADSSRFKRWTRHRPIMTIDGEVIECCNVKIEVLPGLATIMASKLL